MDEAIANNDQVAYRNAQQAALISDAFANQDNNTVEDYRRRYEDMRGMDIESKRASG